LRRCAIIGIRPRALSLVRVAIIRQRRDWRRVERREESFDGARRRLQSLAFARPKIACNRADFGDLSRKVLS
jgi:hypothetical protein